MASAATIADKDRWPALLTAAQAGDVAARDELFAGLYPRWRQSARARMACERLDHTLQATAVLNEEVMNVLRGDALAKATHPAFLHHAMAKEMERVLVDHARKKRSLRRGGEREREPLDDVLEWFERRSIDVEQLARDLKEVEELEPENAQKFEALRLSVFGGYTAREIAVLLEVSQRTVEAHLRYARSSLLRRWGGSTSSQRGVNRRS